MTDPRNFQTAEDRYGQAIVNVRFPKDLTLSLSKWGGLLTDRYRRQIGGFGWLDLCRAIFSEGELELLDDGMTPEISCQYDPDEDGPLITVILGNGLLIALAREGVCAWNQAAHPALPWADADFRWEALIELLLDFGKLPVHTDCANRGFPH